MEEIAGAWFEAINPLDAGDAAATCVPALVIAAGCSFNTESCPNLFDPDVKSGISNGFWLIPPSAAGAWDPTPKKQAEAVYKRYTSDHKESGCLSSVCRQTNCAMAHAGIEQDETTVTHHVFCRGVWPADSTHYAERLTVIGEASVAEVCAREASLLDSLLQNTSVPFSEWAAATKQPGE